MVTVLDDLKELGITAQVTSLGVTFRAKPGAITSELIESLRPRRREIHDALLDEMRAKFVPPEPAPPGDSRCAGCGQPCGSALRCAECAAAMVPQKPGTSRLEASR